MEFLAKSTKPFVTSPCFATAPPIASYISFTAFTLHHNISILIVVAFTLNLLTIFQGFAARPCFPEQSRHQPFLEICGESIGKSEGVNVVFLRKKIEGNQKVKT